MFATAARRPIKESEASATTASCKTRAPPSRFARSRVYGRGYAPAHMWRCASFRSRARAVPPSRDERAFMKFGGGPTHRKEPPHIQKSITNHRRVPPPPTRSLSDGAHAKFSYGSGLPIADCNTRIFEGARSIASDFSRLGFVLISLARAAYACSLQDVFPSPLSPVPHCLREFNLGCVRRATPRFSPSLQSAAVHEVHSFWRFARISCNHAALCLPRSIGAFFAPERRDAVQLNARRPLRKPPRLRRSAAALNSAPVESESAASRAPL